MKCKKCGNNVKGFSSEAIPHYRLYDCGCYAYDSLEEWQASDDCAEWKRLKEWQDEGGTWEEYKLLYNIKTY